MNQVEIRYQIDEDDLLIGFNGPWNEFARENDGVGLESESVAGRSLWGFIHDWETRHIHSSLLKRVRANKPVTNLPFRCDSPALRRFMEMDIILLADKTVEYRCRIIRTEKRKPVPLLLHTAHESKEGPFLRMCGWCKKLDIGNDCWLEIEEAVAALDLFAEKNIRPISHTMCDTCYNALEKKDVASS